MEKLNNDQLKVINSLKDPSTYVTNAANGDEDIGLPYKAIMRAADLSFEKTLLSLGALEAKKLVKHTCAVQRQFVEYLGHSSVEISGQKVVRMFSLTPEGKNV